MKNIITKLTQAGGVLVLALVLGIGASVFAVNYAGPTSTPPGNNAPAPINIKESLQLKGYTDTSGNDVLTESPSLTSYNAAKNNDLLKVFGRASSNNLSVLKESILAGNTVVGVSPTSTDKLTVNLPSYFSGTTSPVKIGGTATTFTRGGRIPPFTVDIANRSGWDGHDFLHVQTNQSNISSTGDTANASTNASIFGFWSDKNSRYADIWAGLPRFNPRPGTNMTNAVLAAYDSNGGANWGTISGSGGGLDLVTVRNSCGIGSVNPKSGQTGYSTNCIESEDGAGTTISVGARAWCPSGYVAIGGGGDCQHFGPGDQGMITQPEIGAGSANSDGSWLYNTTSWTSGQDPKGWRVMCGRGDAHAQVICAKTIPATVTVAVTDPNAGTTPPPPPPTADWHDMTLPRGTTALQSCASWAASDPHFTNISNVHTFRDNGAGSWTDLGQGCAYAELTGGIWFCTAPLTARTNAPIQPKPSFPTSSCSNGVNMKTMIYY